MKLLPNWLLLHRHPALFDTESKTVLEQTAKVYGAMQELIKEHNDFITNADKTLGDFKVETAKEFEEFKSCMQKIMHDHIHSIDLKMDKIKTDMETEFGSIPGINFRLETIEKDIVDIKTGVAALQYNEQTEELNIVTGV